MRKKIGQTVANYNSVVVIALATASRPPQPSVGWSRILARWARYAREDRNPGFGVNYKPLWVVKIWRKREERSVRRIN